MRSLRLAAVLLSLSGPALASGALGTTAILGGSMVGADDELSRSVVKVFIRFGARTASGERKTTTMLCSGTVIARDTVLTAAHCFDAPSEIQHCLGRMVVREPLPLSRESVIVETAGGVRRRAVAVVHPRYRRGFDSRDARSGPDLAVLNLSEPLPDNVTPIELAGADEPAGPRILIAGYGGTDANAQPCDPAASGSDALRRVSLRARETVFPGYCAGEGDCRRDTGANPSPGAWFGDSGGPAFWDHPTSGGDARQRRVIGVIAGTGSGVTLIAEAASFRAWIDDPAPP